MAEVSVYITKQKYLSQLPISDGNLIYLEDTGKICFDIHNSRVEYNTLFAFGTDEERTAYPAIVSGYYFVKETGCLWNYDNGWTRLTKKPEDIVNFTDELPEEGQSGVLYIDRVNQVVYSWDNENKKYIPVSNFTKTITELDIEALFQ